MCGTQTRLLRYQLDRIGEYSRILVGSQHRSNSIDPSGMVGFVAISQACMYISIPTVVFARNVLSTGPCTLFELLNQVLASTFCR